MESMSPEELKLIDYEAHTSQGVRSYVARHVADERMRQGFTLLTSELENQRTLAQPYRLEMPSIREGVVAE